MRFKPNYSAMKLIIIGAITMIVGILLILFRQDATRSLIDWVLTYFICVNLVSLLSRWFKPKEDRESLIGIIIKVIFAGLLVVVNAYTNATIDVIVMMFGTYQLFMATISAITYVLYRHNDITPRHRYLSDAIVYGFLGLGGLLTPNKDAKIQFLIVGIYLVFLGFTYFRDGLFFNADIGYSQLKRRFRVSLPIVLVALIPNRTLRQINDYLQEDGEQTAADLYNLTKEKGVQLDLEVFVHVTENGFGAMGHVDICYQGYVISYGCYDTFSEKLGGAIGDGVLFKAEREAYIDFCKKESHKTLFGYGLKLNDEQKQAVEAQIRRLEAITVLWQPPQTPVPVKEGEAEPMYAWKLQQQTGAKLYKFKESKFKSYFVLSTNCVLLADSIIGQAGTNILSMKGFISPGTYQDFLDKEYTKPHSLVVTRSVY